MITLFVITGAVSFVGLIVLAIRDYKLSKMESCVKYKLYKIR